MNESSGQRARVERVFFEQGWDNVDEIVDWDGDDLDALREFLSEEQFETLLDELSEAGAHER